MNRRRFLELSALSTAGLALAPPLFAENARPVKHLGLQLWSVREDMGKDTPGVVKALSKMGYREVEGFGYNEGKMFNMPFLDFVKLLKDNGITMPSSHVMFTSKSYDAGSKSLTDSAKKAIDDAASIGQRYVVCPYMADEDRTKIPDMVKVYQAAGEYAKKAGVRFGYHNHNFEFEKKGPDGRLIVEWLLHEVDPKLMAMEMDIYWVAFAGHNPLDWFRIYPGRWELCHVKDMARSEKRESIEVGDGSIDFPTILGQSAKAGLQYYIVELEAYKTTPMQGVERSRENFLKLRF